MTQPADTTPPSRRWQSKVHPAAVLVIICVIVSTLLMHYRLTSSWTSSIDLSFSEPTTLTGQNSSWPQSSESDRQTSRSANTTRSKTIRSNRTEGMHMCTCLTDGNPRNANLPDKPKRIRWLHIPKTGTSFMTTLWSYAASNSERYIDLAIHSHVCGMFDNSSYSMYDFALMRRYPWEMYGAQNMIPPSSLSGEIKKDKMHFGLVGGTQHHPLSPSEKNAEYTSSKHFKMVKDKLLLMASEIFDRNITVTSFFRQPEERLVSAYHDGRHSSGFKQKNWNNLVKASVVRNGDPANHKCVIDGQIYRNPLECFVRFPGIAGCMTRMLTGETCADDILGESGMENLPFAIDIVMNHLDFVGLTDDWNESICQFHRLFMGKMDKLSGKRRWDQPLQGEFSNVHKALRKKVLDVEHLNGFKDLADTVLYEAAKLKFKQIVGEKRCYEYMPIEEIEARKEADPSDLPFLKMDEDGHFCEPMSCADLGKQCGEWDDGCGKTIICGMCNIGRTGLPSTWRVRCVEGQCIDYCPPWNEKGYWFLSDESPPAIRKVTQELNIDQQKQLSPVDAVRICEVACTAEANNEKRQDGIRSFVHDGLCQCGKTPGILQSNLTMQDFLSAHDLNVLCREEKARKLGVLNDNETQPICCPYIGQKPQMPPQWKKPYTIGPNAFEGEYFDHIPLECGAFKECEMVGRQNNAEMVVFDLFNSMCYLARNIISLGDYYGVTKDNPQRYGLILGGTERVL